MRCPACGARYQNRATRCPDCGALQENQIDFSPQASADPINPEKEIVAKPVLKTQPVVRKTRSLLEFPGGNRNPMPQWRKELGERVREVQEKRAREAILETAEIGPLFSGPEAKTTPMLELLPQAEMPQINPVVVAALERIERARSQGGRNYGTATAIAYEQQPIKEMELNIAAVEPAIEEAAMKPERVYALAVVPPPELISPELPEEPSPKEVRRPKRLIDGQNDPALNYLDSIPRSVIVEKCEYRCASPLRRMFGALVDLVMVGVLAAPFLALTELTGFQWQNPRVIGLAVGTIVVIGFLYLTISVAFTGRTVGMKLCSLRVVDARTGLIPTGSQSAGRSLLYLLSLAGVGLALLYAFLNDESQTVHDRCTRTAVIRA
jgi:uncharacterized RDD family membrane protein YckC